jgi:serine/threonine protein kinase
MPAKLIVTAGPDKGRVFPLQPGETLQIGRSQATPTKLADASVSRVHCEIEVGDNGAVLHNISANGTLVNGRTVTEHHLTPGDLIRIGNTELRYMLDEGSEASTVVQGTPTASLPLTSLVGRTISHYTVESVIARGSSGVVFQARDTDNNQTVALKVLNPEFSRNEEEMQRFVRAMKTMLPIRHPNLVAIYGAGKAGPYCWVAMQHVEGEALTQVIQRIGVAGMLDWKYAYRVAVHVARALEYAHGQSIIHRNVTPQNILYRTSDKAVLLGDLMLAKALEGSLAQQVTRPGELLGDLSYMAPERTRGAENVDGRSDLYGLGATVYALLTGRPPFGGGAPAEVVQRIRTMEPEKPKKYQLSTPDQFQGLVLRLLAKRPEERFQTATDVLTDLQRIGKLTGASA